MRVPPSQSLTRCAAAASACSRRLSAQRARDAGQPRAEGEDLDVAAPPATSACASCRLSSVRAFIEPETSISSSSLRGRCAPLQASQPQHLAVVAHAVAQGAAQIGERAAPRAHAPVAAPPRQARAAPRAQAGAARRPSRSPRSGARPAPRRGRRRARIRWLRRRASGSSSPRPSSCRRTISSSSASAPRRAPRCRGNGCRTARSRSRAARAAARASPARRGGCRRVARPEQLDRREERRGLLRRDGEAVGAQQRGKGRRRRARRAAIASSSLMPPPPRAGRRAGRR